MSIKMLIFVLTYIQSKVGPKCDQTKMVLQNVFGLNTSKRVKVVIMVLVVVVVMSCVAVVMIAILILYVQRLLKF